MSKAKCYVFSSLGRSMYLELMLGYEKCQKTLLSAPLRHLRNCNFLYTKKFEHSVPHSFLQPLSFSQSKSQGSAIFLNGEQSCTILRGSVKLVLSRAPPKKTQDGILKWVKVILGVKVRNMKMDFNTGGTWCQVGQ